MGLQEAMEEASLECDVQADAYERMEEWSFEDDQVTQRRNQV